MAKQEKPEDPITAAFISLNKARLGQIRKDIFNELIAAGNHIGFAVYMSDFRIDCQARNELREYRKNIEAVKALSKPEVLDEISKVDKESFERLIKMTKRSEVLHENDKPNHV